MFCPACGASLDADERFAHLVTCPWCHSSFVLDEQAARVTGEMAVLPPTPSPLSVGTTGRVLDRAFTVLGRVRYGWDQGYWDEWFVAFEDGASAWISEDEGNYTLETWSELHEAPAEYADVSPGSRLRLGDTEYHVDEKNVARCEGAEGQLPFEVAIGEEVPYLDLSHDEAFATVEYDSDGIVRTFLGRRLTLSEITIDVAWAAGGVTADTLDRTGGGKRLVKTHGTSVRIQCDGCGSTLTPPEADDDRMDCPACGTSIDLTLRREICPSCDASVPLFGGAEARTAVCPSCRGQMDVSGTVPELVARLVTDRKRPRVPFRLGQACVLRGKTYRIAGHIRLHEKEEGRHYYSDEFLLHGSDGYRWLVMENGHFSLNREVAGRPRQDPKSAVAGRSFPFSGRSWRVFESGRTDIVWVDGELPWVAKVGDVSRYMDATRPPHLLSAEWTGNELEWSEAEYVPQTEIAEAFKLSPDKLPRAKGVAPHQPYGISPFRAQTRWVMLVFFFVNLLLALFMGLPDGTLLKRLHLAGDDYNGQAFLTETFDVRSVNALIKARFRADVSDSWVYLDGAVIDEDDQALIDFSQEISYYSGYEGGERWTEGSKDESMVFKLKKPGPYRFLLQGESGGGFTRFSSAPDVDIEIFEGPGIKRWLFILAGLCLAWFLVEVICKWSFEATRWAESDVED